MLSLVSIQHSAGWNCVSAQFKQYICFTSRLSSYEDLLGGVGYHVCLTRYLCARRRSSVRSWEEIGFRSIFFGWVPHDLTLHLCFSTMPHSHGKTWNCLAENVTRFIDNWFPMQFVCCELLVRPACGWDLWPTAVTRTDSNQCFHPLGQTTMSEPRQPIIDR
jgi:hypothetical protein